MQARKRAEVFSPVEAEGNKSRRDENAEVQYASCEDEIGQRVANLAFDTHNRRRIIGQIEAQLKNMVQTRYVQDVSRDPNGVERELALVKVRGTAPSGSRPCAWPISFAPG